MYISHVSLYERNSELNNKLFNCNNLRDRMDLIHTVIFSSLQKCDLDPGSDIQSVTVHNVIGILAMPSEHLSQLKTSLFGSYFTATWVMFVIVIIIISFIFICLTVN